MQPVHFCDLVVRPSLRLIERITGIGATPEAEVMVMAIAGQESDWDARKQYGGPARSYWQFEEGGGVYGVLTHAASAGPIREICRAIDIDTVDTGTIYEAMAWSSFLGCSMARLLLYTDPAALPAVNDVSGSWDYYLRNWRPGAPHPETWPGVHGTAVALLRSDFPGGTDDAPPPPPPQSSAPPSG
jgi:hypothetical protein